VETTLPNLDLATLAAPTIPATPTVARSKLVFGTVQLGVPYGINNTSGQPSKEDALQILRHVHQAGIATLDTADAYGTASELIGAFHREQPQRPFRVITKFHCDDSINLLEKARATCSRLGVTTLYCYQYHRFADLAAFPHVQHELAALKEQGVIERVGVSIYTNDEFRTAIDTPSIDVIQLPFNALDNMRLRGELMRHAKEQGKELHTRSVFLQGLLFKPPSDFPDKLASLAPAVQRLQNLAESCNLDITALALNYALHNPLIDAVLFGVETASQLRSTLNAVHTNVDAALSAEIETIVVREPHLLNPAHWS
jgi:aryl-alcohol dehydrogenase-like predicted oxidoreductase